MEVQVRKLGINKYLREMSQKHTEKENRPIEFSYGVRCNPKGDGFILTIHKNSDEAAFHSVPMTRITNDIYTVEFPKSNVKAVVEFFC